MRENEGPLLEATGITMTYGDSRVIHNLDLQVRPGEHGVPGSAYTTEQALEALGLTHLGERRHFTLSSGQRQRASLSLALVRPWSLLFLDEPEQRLDALFRDLLAEILNNLVTVNNRAIIMATHSRPLLETSGTRELSLETETGESPPRASAWVDSAPVPGTLILWMGAALTQVWPLALITAPVALIFTLLWPLVAVHWQRRGAELIPRWRMLTAYARTEALSTSLLTVDSTAMLAVADIENTTGRELPAARMRQLAHEENKVALHLAGPAALRRDPSRTPRRTSLLGTSGQRAARANAGMPLLMVLMPSALAVLGSANLALGAAVVLASLVGTALSRTLGELASLHRLRRQWALRTPPPTVQVGGGLVLLGGGTALCAVGGAVGVLSLMGVELPALGVLVAWLVVAVGAAVSGIVGAAVNALKSMKADIRIITSPEFGPIPVYLIERIISGRIGPVIALIVLLNGFALGAIIVALFFVGNGIFDLREEIRGADFSDTHVIKRGTKA